jgi:hypothetical protein
MWTFIAVFEEINIISFVENISKWMHLNEINLNFDHYLVV